MSLRIINTWRTIFQVYLTDKYCVLPGAAILQVLETERKPEDVRPGIQNTVLIVPLHFWWEFDVPFLWVRPGCTGNERVSEKNCSEADYRCFERSLVFINVTRRFKMVSRADSRVENGNAMGSCVRKY
jgi:hypothetical protein